MRRLPPDPASCSILKRVDAQRFVERRSFAATVGVDVLVERTSERAEERARPGVRRSRRNATLALRDREVVAMDAR